MKNKYAWITLLVAMCGLVLVYTIQHNWGFHARFNLLLRGYVFYHLKSPRSSEDILALHSSEPISKLVIKDGVCVGYLDPYADFQLVTKGEIHNANQSIVIVSVLFYLQFVFLFVLFITILKLFFVAINKKHRLVPRLKD